MVNLVFWTNLLNPDVDDEDCGVEDDTEDTEQGEVDGADTVYLATKSYSMFNPSK